MVSMHQTLSMKYMFLVKYGGKKKFSENNWNLYKTKTNNIFYTGNLIFGERLSLKLRMYLSKVFGSSCNIYFLKRSFDGKKLMAYLWFFISRILRYSRLCIFFFKISHSKIKLKFFQHHYLCHYG